MRGRKGVPITVRGVLYPSQKAAAAALGVSTATVNAAFKNGTLDFVGMGPRRGDGNNRPVRVNGTLHESTRAAAIATGIPYAEFSAWVRVQDILAARGLAVSVLN